MCRLLEPRGSGTLFRRGMWPAAWARAATNTGVRWSELGAGWRRIILGSGEPLGGAGSRGPPNKESTQHTILRQHDRWVGQSALCERATELRSCLLLRHGLVRLFVRERDNTHSSRARKVETGGNWFRGFQGCHWQQ